MTNHAQYPTRKGGVSYFLSGFELITTKGLKRFVFIPLIVNLILFSIAFYWLYLQIDGLMVELASYIPDFLSWLTFIIQPILLIGVLTSFSYIFSSVTNWLAAPFNGLLAEKVEAYLTGKSLEQQSLTDVLKDLPRTLGREFKKLRYYLPRAIGFILLLLFIPGIGHVIWFLFTAWMMAIQYCDYRFDNHKIDFDEMKYQLNQRKGLSYSFGMITTVFSMLPIVNLVVMPVAICGATKLCVENFPKR